MYTIKNTLTEFFGSEKAEAILKEGSINLGYSNSWNDKNKLGKLYAKLIRIKNPDKNYKSKRLGRCIFETTFYLKDNEHELELTSGTDSSD